MRDSATDLSPRQAANHLGWTIRYIYELIYTNRLEARKQDGLWRISRRAVEALKNSSDRRTSGVVR